MFRRRALVALIAVLIVAATVAGVALYLTPFRPALVRLSAVAPINSTMLAALVRGPHTVDLTGEIDAHPGQALLAISVTGYLAPSVDPRACSADLSVRVASTTYDARGHATGVEVSRYRLAQSPGRVAQWIVLAAPRGSVLAGFSRRWRPADSPVTPDALLLAVPFLAPYTLTGDGGAGLCALPDLARYATLHDGRLSFDPSRATALANALSAARLARVYQVSPVPGFWKTREYRAALARVQLAPAALKPLLVTHPLLTLRAGVLQLSVARSEHLSLVLRLTPCAPRRVDVAPVTSYLRRWIDLARGSSSDPLSLAPAS